MSAGGAGYPLTLDVTDRRVVLVGGGPVAARRATALVGAGGSVVVIAPWLCEELQDLVSNDQIRWHQRDYAAGDLDGAWLVHTATGDRDIDTAVAADAEAARVWCVVASDAGASSAWTPAVARVDDVTVAVSGGGDPRRAAALRTAVVAAMQTGDLPMRRHRRGRTGIGCVALVGGGPGDAGLITTRGRRILAEADVVVVDRLAPRSLVDDLPADVVVVDVGKTSGHHPVPQHEINALLVRHALAGARVVRLKGGDPYVLGRGGEELIACEAAGVPVEVVPGVTSAVSAPAAVGIPVTHRGVARGFTVITGHDDLSEVPTHDQHTLVLLMGVERIGAIAASLIARGFDASTPVAVVEDAYGPRQRATFATLTTIAAVAAEQQVRPPAVIVVGAVVRLAPGWTEPVQDQQAEVDDVGLPRATSSVPSARRRTRAARTPALAGASRRTT